MTPIPAPHRLSSHRYADSSEQERGLIGWEQRYAQCDPGPYAGRIDRLELPGLAISRESVACAVEQSTAPPAGRVIFCQTLVPAGPWRFNAQSCMAGLTGFIRGGEEHLAVLPAGAEVLMVEADTELLARDLGEPPRSLLLETAFLALPEAAEIRALAEWFALLLREPAPMSALIPDLMLYNLGRLWGRTRREARALAPACRADYRIFRRAEALARDGALETPTVSALAAALDLEVPALRRAFLNTTGLGPTDWLRRYRLDGARRALLAAPPERTVTEIAMAWGFTHLGRFSAAYGAQFGESPSATRKRARP
ncbi:hypothetical protein LPB142_09680 [Rhodobacter xanthinilyticus]|uniref:HTH araC/xylS-type domain-containing protein n=1 Tax=Rhodobacter xanthinilyticus TaxID=1850250 RepID=A0A1D9MCM4_9RHOB|nr:helix-turn-helix domain-containing protein [Rhodobacter xanthinilyticus]AOZ69550.1 hypothetical protein LPB142_09680 [Rhodobacter xanthinilyticus]